MIPSQIAVEAATPRTSYAFEGDLSVGVQPEIATWEEAKNFARTLEWELNESQQALALMTKSDERNERGS